MSFADQPATSGGPQSGQTAAQVRTIVRDLVADAALEGDATAWPSTKITLPDSDAITQGSTNLYLSASGLATRLAAQLSGGSNVTVTQTGNNFEISSTDTNTQLSNEQVEDIVGAMINFTAGTSGATFTYNDTTGKLDIDFSSLSSGGGGTFSPTKANIYAAVKAILQQGTNITITPDDTNSELTFASSGGGGGGSFTLNMANLRPVLNNVLLTDSTISKTVSTTNNTITLASQTGMPDSMVPVAASSNVAMASNHVGAYVAISPTADIRYTFNSGMGINGQMVIVANEGATAGNDIAVHGGASGGLLRTLKQNEWYPFLRVNGHWIELLEFEPADTPVPTGTHNFYVGHRSALSFAAPTLWTPSEAENTYDVSQAGTTITVDITNIPDNDYVYLVAPQDREPTSVIDSVGAESVNDFAEQVGAVTVSGTVYNVYTVQNVSGRSVPSIRYVITVE